MIIMVKIKKYKFNLYHLTIRLKYHSDITYQASLPSTTWQCINIIIIIVMAPKNENVQIWIWSSQWKLYAWCFKQRKMIFGWICEIKAINSFSIYAENERNMHPFKSEPQRFGKFQFQEFVIPTIKFNEMLAKHRFDSPKIGLIKANWIRKRYFSLAIIRPEIHQIK